MRPDSACRARSTAIGSSSSPAAGAARGARVRPEPSKRSPARCGQGRRDRLEGEWSKGVSQKLTTAKMMRSPIEAAAQSAARRRRASACPCARRMSTASDCPPGWPASRPSCLASMIVARNALGLGNLLILDRRLQNHAVRKIVDQLTLDFLPRRLMRWVLVAAMAL
jgi:hypothetical protein